MKLFNFPVFISYEFTLTYYCLSSTYSCNFETDNKVHMYTITYKQMVHNSQKDYLLNVDFCGFDSGLCVIFENLKISYLSPILYLLQGNPLETTMKLLGKSCNLKGRYFHIREIFILVYFYFSERYLFQRDFYFRE